MSEPRGGEAGAETGRAAPVSSPGRKALDLLVFAPAGLLVTAVEELPELAAKGRTRFEVHLRNARFVGQMVVTTGQVHLRDRVARFTGPREEPAAAQDAVRPSRPARPTDYPPTPGADLGAEQASAFGGPADGSGSTGTSPPPSTGPAAPSAADWAIPGYDTLSASQVVRRLDGLGIHELQAVSRYEVETRGRRTILHRVQQLLGAEDEPGQPGVPS